jgi:hypothetical protein
MIGAKPRTDDQGGQGMDPVAAGRGAGFALLSERLLGWGMDADVARGSRATAKARREVAAFGRAAAHFAGLHDALLPDGLVAGSWWREQISPQKGVIILCGQSFTHLRWGFSRPCLPVATPRANKSPLAPVRGPSDRLCWGGICSPGLRSAQRPILSIARKTPAVARATTASVSLICQPIRATADIHANAAGEPRARLRRFAFRHTKEQGTANV